MTFRKVTRLRTLLSGTLLSGALLRRTLISGALLSGTLLSGTLLSPTSMAEKMQHDQVLKIAVSNRGMTRISVQGDAVSEMYFYPDEFQDHVTLHKSGHVFVAGEGLDRPLFITLITRKGEIQDLQIQAKAITAKPITLQTSRVDKVEVKTAQAWLEDFARGYVPHGFQREILLDTDRIHDSFRIHATDSFVNESHVVTVFEVTNVISKDLEINLREFSRPGEGIYVRKKSLKPKESTQLVTIRKRAEGLTENAF